MSDNFSKWHTVIFAIPAHFNNYLHAGSITARLEGENCSIYFSTSKRIDDILEYFSRFH